jgi:DNA-binding response OmpR family regulator/serine phosphatase RsbU (regulator of sigma subunit)
MEGDGAGRSSTDVSGSVDSETPLVALVVDDRESSRHLLASLLDRAGFSVLTEGTGAAALEVARTRQPDLAILDVNLPDMSGFEVCEAIRADPQLESTPVVHVSATAVDSRHRTEGLLRGADAYLTEPLEPREFLAIVTSLVRRTKLRQRTLRTTTRLRMLNVATADVHAASSEDRVFEALSQGAANIASDVARVISRSADATLAWTSDGGGSTVEQIDAHAVAGLLEPAEAGHTVLETDDSTLVAGAHLGVPFIDETGGPAGAILVPASVEDVADEVLPLLAQLALTTTLALTNLRALDIEHRIALTLQQSLLPQAPPVLDGVRVALRYLAASPEAQVGGDFYEAFALDPHRTFVAIGDVVGHSMHAATVMGEIGHAIRAYAIDGHGPQEVMARLERLISRFHPDDFTSAICGVLDTATRSFEFCGAGHLPIVTASSSGAAVVESGGTLLGLNRPTLAPKVIHLAEGDRIWMVTDGLIEQTREPLDVGLARLCSAVAEVHADDLETAIDRVLSTVGPAGALLDDIAIVVLQLTS